MASGEQSDPYNEQMNDDVEVSTLEADMMKIKKKQWIQTQIDSQKCHINAAAAETSLPKEKEKLDEMIGNLLEDLQREYIEKDKKELIMKRLQLGDYMIKELFRNPQDKGDNSEEKKSEEQEYLEELLLKQCNLVSDIMRTLKDYEELRKKLDEIQKTNFELKAESRVVMKELKKKTEAAKIVHNQETRSLCQDIDLKMQMTAMIKHILMGLIIGSGVNWAQDEELQTLVFKLGETVE